jgi:hypothetical protein
VTFFEPLEPYLDFNGLDRPRPATNIAAIIKTRIAHSLLHDNPWWHGLS